MKYKENWNETREKFQNWWKQKNTGRPLMNVIARKPLSSNLSESDSYESLEDKYFNAEKMVKRYRQYCKNHIFLGESFPNMSVDFGPGSLAGYIGSNIVFNKDTVWFEELNGELKDISFDPENSWYKKHLKLIKDCRNLAGNDFLICIPDLMENIDVLSSLRGAQNVIFDMMDEPRKVEKWIDQITKCYPKYYDSFYDVVEDEYGGSAYTVFQIYGSGKTVKLQCDFSAMMSPDNFKDFIVDSLQKQGEKLDNVLYHLDGPDAIKHVDALMKIDEIDALQWTSGDYGPDGTLEEWDVIYDKVRNAGKSLWIKIYSGEYEDWIKNVDRIVNKYGSHSLFLNFPEMSLAQAEYLMEYAEKNWSDIRGSYSSY